MRQRETVAPYSKAPQRVFDNTPNPFPLSLHLSGVPTPARQSQEERGLARDEVRLLVLHRATGRIEHTQFLKLTDFLRAGDVLVVNDSKTLPASMPAIRVKTGSHLRIHLALCLTPTVYVVERRTMDGLADEQPFDIGEQLFIGGVATTVLGHFHPNSRLWYVESRGDLWQAAATCGQPIRYEYLQSRPDLDAYQTVFARHSGSAEMPSAARPFSNRVLSELRQNGVAITNITLHTGVSSHEVVGSLDDHPFLPEWFSVPQATADVVNRANRDGRRVIAAGTTVVRALAAATGRDGLVMGNKSGWTTVVITPNNPPVSVTSLLTGLHHDATSHLAMLYAFVTPEQLHKAYEEALHREYLWHEFGDSNLIL
jgi:S-adenosylmethionine:tRNA ribosyltransferase-isomerase